VQQTSDDNDTSKFLGAELRSFNTITGTSNMAEHQITLKDDKPIKQRYYHKNPKVQWEINANGVHRALKKLIQLSHRDG